MRERRQEQHDKLGALTSDIVLDDGLDPQAALDRRRFCIVDGEASGVVGLEEGINDRILHDLAAMGHDIDPDPVTSLASRDS